MKIRKGDNVLIITGKDKGKKGKVLRTIPATNKIVVEGLNVVKKHVKARRQGEKGQRVELPSPLSAGKVMLVCPKCGKNTRVGYRVSGETKSRLCKKCGKEI